MASVMKDRRVTGAEKSGYAVETRHGVYQVRYTAVFHWTITAPGGQYAPMQGGPSGLAIGFATAEDAIAVLLESTDPGPVHRRASGHHVPSRRR